MMADRRNLIGFVFHGSFFMFFWLEPKEPKVQGIRQLADCQANAQRLR